MITVAEILRAKPQAAVYSVTPTTSVLEAIKLMAEKGIGALVVLDKGRLAGIVSERDYARKVVLLERAAGDISISEIMTADVLTVSPRDTSQHCMQLMTDRHLRHLPVLAEGELIGLLSIGDLVKTTIAEQASLIQQLEQYIRGE
ncbi:CBS domain-containing protein [Pseudomonas spirodelae]|jgi:CBS domain-containing protein|uniref:CBS domain-containing protein n=1 Tax=Pseudomonas spirodelae TaxID=3101751 RepID=A0ABU5PBL1_9PSED|nr:CBS domain-containing protein [Pseudomonas sp. T5W1]MBU0807295.1 CBS domain-containing protein [Gammaproteobacteria bacterium]MBU0883837.1 CBS domain-containing protein [Gammaproteobacteria bacterium]MBU0901929.1 CBS domain-containing protein [Gammaproteobacteria bacterium]MBU1859637.1 CBS domain-containing protein [Gammaproteobacteria bacterium]MEA1607075.1 CBS domain-containing protein [Pseudomonas sp. T5W1]